MSYKYRLQQFYRIISSPGLMGILLAVLGIVLILAATMENNGDRQAAHALIYDTLWFELLWFLLAVNLIGIIVHQKYWQTPKWPLLIFHGAFLIALLGAAITRYTGQHGEMHLREHEQKSHFLTNDDYLHITAYTQKDTIQFYRRAYLTDARQGRIARLKIKDQTFHISFQDFMENAISHVVEDKNGKPAIRIAAHHRRDVQEVLLKAGEYTQVHGEMIAFNRKMPNALQLSFRTGNVFFKATDTVNVVNPKLPSDKAIAPGKRYLFRKNEVLKWRELELALLEKHSKASIVYANQPQETALAGKNVLRLNVECADDDQSAYISHSEDAVSNAKVFRFKGVNFRIGLGGKRISVPFSLKLNGFDMERFKTSKTPASYTASVKLEDPMAKTTQTYNLGMNEMIRHKGYSIYQASYDMDEQGSVLAITYNFAGRWLLIAALAIFAAGVVLTLLRSGSRFRGILKNTQILPKTLKILPLLLLLMPLSQKATATQKIPEAQARTFSRILAKGRDGRIQPLGTIAYKLLRKFSEKESLQGQSPGQVLMAIMLNPEKSQKLPLLHIKNKQLRNVLNTEESYIAFEDLFEKEGQFSYKLNRHVEVAYMKSPESRTQFDKAVIDLDERINQLSLVFSGRYFRILPDSSGTNWRAINLIKNNNKDKDEDEDELEALFGQYIKKMRQARRTSDYTAGKEILADFIAKQREAAGHAAISPLKVRLELWYNRIHIFSGLYVVLAIAGILLLFAGLWLNIRPPSWLCKRIKWFRSMLIVLVILLALALFLRGYLSGHAPWNSGYEALIFMGWAGLAAGLLFMHKSLIAPGIGCLFAATLLQAGELHFLNPDIFHLNHRGSSLWLSAHIATVAAGFAFLGIAALTGALSLLIMMFRLPALKNPLNRLLHHLTQINELHAMPGLYLVALGTAFGAVWTNESAGITWNWAPWQSWLLITLLAWIFVTHTRLIPGFRGKYTFHLGTVLAYSFVIITFFGIGRVREFIKPTPEGPVSLEWIITLIVFAVIALGAFLNENKLGIRKDHPES